MGDVLVTLRFGDTLVDVECNRAEVPTEADNEADIPADYVRLETAEEFVPSDTSTGATLPLLREGNTALVRQEHVAMIQRGD